MAEEIEAKIYEALGLSRDLVKEIEHDESRRWPPAVGAGQAGQRRRRPPRSGAWRSHDARADRRAAAARARARPTRYLNRRERTVSEVRAPSRAQGRRAGTGRGGDRRRWSSRATSTTRASRGCSSHDKRELEQWGSERIRRGLLAAGIDRELVERALARERATRGDERDRARARAGAAAPPLPDAAARTGASASARSGVLLRKGYESELALDALAAHAAASAPSRARAGAASWCAARLRRHPPGTTMEAANERPCGPQNTSKSSDIDTGSSVLTAICNGPRRSVQIGHQTASASRQPIGDLVAWLASVRASRTGRSVAPT